MTEAKTSIDGVQGFRVAGIHAGLKKEGKLDFALIVSDLPCVTAGVFTTNKVKSPSVLYNQCVLQEDAQSIRAVAINTVCANACTGDLGYQNAERTAAMVAGKIGSTANQVLVMSTGVIGTHLPMDKIETGVIRSSSALGNGWFDTAAAIMTTDTKPKLASVTVETDEGSYTVAGISKGSGMIAPNMATMLGVIVTDAQLSPDLAGKTLKSAVDVSYNRIVVDGDNSTNDTVLLMANGASGVAIDIDAASEFEEALRKVCVQLAQDIVRDGEGVTKFITLQIRGAKDDVTARQIGNTIATSALVKTAFYGNDANWGRIIAAAGRAGVDFDPNVCELWFSNDNASGLRLFAEGMPDTYSEERATEIISQPEIFVTLDCHMGDGSAVIWTCDLSHDYVSINADYRT